MIGMSSWGIRSSLNSIKSLDQATQSLAEIMGNLFSSSFLLGRCYRKRVFISRCNHSLNRGDSFPRRKQQVQRSFNHHTSIIYRFPCLQCYSSGGYTAHREAIMERHQRICYCMLTLSLVIATASLVLSIIVLARPNVLIR